MVSRATASVFKGKLYQFNKVGKKIYVIGDVKKYEFHVCITPSQIIQFIDDQGQDKSSLSLNKQTYYIWDVWDYYFLKAAWQ